MPTPPSPFAGHFTGAASTELAIYDPADDSLWLGTYNFDIFAPAFVLSPWGNAGPRDLAQLRTGDFNADGRVDLLARDTASGEIVVGLNGGAGFTVARWGATPYAASWRFVAGRFVGLPQTDVVGYDPATRTFWMGENVQKQCDNGFDDDGDGALDQADGGCSLAHSQMAKEEPQCSDGVDNDADLAVDHPADSKCRGAWDDDEATNPSCGLMGPEGLLVFAALRRRRRRTTTVPTVG